MDLLAWLPKQKVVVLRVELYRVPQRHHDNDSYSHRHCELFPQITAEAAGFKSERPCV